MTPPPCPAPGTGWASSIPLTCGGIYWSHEGDVPGYNTIGAVSSDGRTTVALSLDSNVEDPQLAAEYAPRRSRHVRLRKPGPARADRARHHPGRNAHGPRHGCAASSEGSRPRAFRVRPRPAADAAAYWNMF